MSAVNTPGDENLNCTATPELATNGTADVEGAGSAAGDGADEVPGDDDGAAGVLATAGGIAPDGAASPSAPVKDKPRPTTATTARQAPPVRLFTARHRYLMRLVRSTSGTTCRRFETVPSRCRSR